MFRVTRFGIISLCLLLAACAASVRTDHAPGVNFASYHVFAWSQPTAQQPVKNPILDSEILSGRIKNAVVNALLGRGYAEARDNGKPDFYVTYHTTSEQKLQSSGFSGSIGIFNAYPHGVGSIYFPVGRDVDSYTQAALVIDILDGKTKQLVWRGWMNSRLNQKEFDQASINATVKQILTQFPPR